MRYPASEKREIICLVEQSHLPVRRALDKLGIAKTTFYRWYDRYRSFGLPGLEDRTSGPGRIWNRILLENDYLPGDLENRIAEFVDHYNNHRYPESINNVTPAGAYFGRDKAIIERKAKIKKRTIQKRRLFHQQYAAYHQTSMSQIIR